MVRKKVLGSCGSEWAHLMNTGNILLPTQWHWVIKELLEQIYSLCILNSLFLTIKNRLFTNQNQILNSIWAVIKWSVCVEREQKIDLIWQRMNSTASTNCAPNYNSTLSPLALSLSVKSLSWTKVSEDGNNIPVKMVTKSQWRCCKAVRGSPSRVLS